MSTKIDNYNLKSNLVETNEFFTQIKKYNNQNMKIDEIINEVNNIINKESLEIDKDINEIQVCLKHIENIYKLLEDIKKFKIINIKNILKNEYSEEYKKDNTYKFSGNYEYENNNNIKGTIFFNRVLHLFDKNVLEHKVRLYSYDYPINLFEKFFKDLESKNKKIQGIYINFLIKMYFGTTESIEKINEIKVKNYLNIEDYIEFLSKKKGYFILNDNIDNELIKSIEQYKSDINAMEICQKSFEYYRSLDNDNKKREFLQKIINDEITSIEEEITTSKVKTTETTTSGVKPAETTTSAQITSVINPNTVKQSPDLSKEIYKDNNQGKPPTTTSEEKSVETTTSGVKPEEDKFSIYKKIGIFILVLLIICIIIFAMKNLYINNNNKNNDSKNQI